jgi:hypothetical protein
MVSERSTPGASAFSKAFRMGRVMPPRPDDAAVALGYAADTMAKSDG